jgi:aryl-alcohol dehydrogenase-like predicted oxidoreductase
MTGADRIRLGRSEVEVGPMGVGAWAWGDRMTWGYGVDYGKNDVREAFEASLAAGLRFFDTAEIYGVGRSEKLLGEFARGSRDRLLVATKFFPLPWRLFKGDLIRALRGSLQRLGLPQVDLYQIHWPFPPRPVGFWAAALAEAVRLGLSRAVGVSNCDVAQTREAHWVLASMGVPLASNQIEFSLLGRTPERNGLLDVCRDLGVTIIAYSPLAMGLLTGKFTSSHPPPPMRRRAILRASLDRLPALIAAEREIGQAHGGKTPGQVALNWVISKGAVPIPGAKTAAQARENAGAIGWTLSPEEARHLERLADTVVGR